MTKAERFGRWLIEARQTHPRRTAIIAWSFTALILLLALLSFWHAFSQGRPWRLIIACLVAAYVARKVYRQGKAAKSGQVPAAD